MMRLLKSLSTICFILIPKIGCNEEDCWDAKMSTFDPEQYFLKVGRGEGLETTIPANVLGSSWKKDRAESYVDRCAKSYRNLGTYFENRYMTYNFVKQFEDYTVIRKEYLRAKFHELSPLYAKMDQNDKRYKKSWAYHLKNREKTEFDPYSRCFCFIVWMLTSPEWKVADLDDGYLKTFWQALENHSPIDTKDAPEVAHAFAICWSWVWNLACVASKQGVGISNLKPEYFQKFVDTFKELETNDVTAHFCARLFNQMYSGNPEIAIATLSNKASTIRSWPDADQEVDFELCTDGTMKSLPFSDVAFLTSTTEKCSTKPTSRRRGVPNTET